jgi:hypothetical protein
MSGFAAPLSGAAFFDVFLIVRAAIVYPIVDSESARSFDYSTAKVFQEQRTPHVTVQPNSGLVPPDPER